MLWDVWILTYGAVNIPPWLVLEVATGGWSYDRVDLAQAWRALTGGGRW